MSGETGGGARADEKIIVGRITGAYGVKGWVKVYSWTEPREGITRYRPWYLKHPDEADWREVTLKSGKRQGKTVIAAIEGIDDRDQAIALTGQEIAIEESRIEPLGDDEFYWRELIGLSVHNRQGTVLGEITSLMETGANDVLVVRAVTGREHLIPYVPGEIVLAVDLPEGTMEVDWEESWLDAEEGDEA